MYRSSKLLRINESCKYGKSVKYPIGIVGECWRGCFAWKEMFCNWVIPSLGSHILGRLHPSDPSLVLLLQSSSLPPIHAMSPKGLLADECHSSWEVMTRRCPTPPSGKLSPQGTRKALLSGSWNLTISGQLPTPGNSRQANRCESVTHKLPFTRARDPQRRPDT